MVYGIMHSDLLNDTELILEVPSECAKSMIANRSKIALLPSGALPLVKDAVIFSKYCIGAHKKVNTVMLYSNCPLGEIRTVFLDSDSVTSVGLVKILFKYHWMNQPNFSALLNFNIQKNEAVLAIGDKTFEMNGVYNFQYDLAEEWYNYTGLPFVFAIWASASILSVDFINRFDQAMHFGLCHKQEAVKLIHNNVISFDSAINYLENSIDYDFNEQKKTALKLYLKLLSTV